MLIWTHVLPPAGWAIAINASSVAIMAAVLALPGGRGYGWLLADVRARVLCCVLLCLTPGLNEMAGNYANLPWLFFFTVAFLALRDPQLPLPFWSVLLSVAAITSTAQGVFAIPLLVWRTWDAVHRRRGRSQVLRNAAVLAALCLSVYLLWLAREREAPTLPMESWFVLLKTWVNTTMNSVLLLPLLGDLPAVLVRVRSSVWVRTCVVPVLLVILAIGVFRVRRRPAAMPILLLALGVLSWPAVASVARPASVALFRQPLTLVFAKHRYAFPSGIVASLVWMFVVHNGLKARGWRAGATIVLFAAGLGIGAHRFHIAAYGTEPKWSVAVRALEREKATGCPNPVVAPIYPGELWVFAYEDPRRPKCESGK
jgi:hypothetical protein